MIASRIESTRLDLASSIDRDRKNTLGQFLTPNAIAQFMTGLFRLPRANAVTVLDAGAGIGSLSAAVLERIIDSPIERAEVLAFELDSEILPYLQQTLKNFSTRFTQRKKKLSAHIFHNDYIEQSSLSQISTWHKPIDLAILNPPYGKIKSNSRYRAILRESGIETVNLYTGFVALALQQLRIGGQLVAIIPRSFCNGPYYKPFRQMILKNASLEYIHLFESRRQAFKEDGVLQENIIIHLIKGKKQSPKVTVSTSHGIEFGQVNRRKIPVDQIVIPHDKDSFIHIPSESPEGLVLVSNKFDSSVEELGVLVSTGPIVDFRMKDYLLRVPSKKSIPLLYPAHFKGWNINYPILNFKKSNAIALTNETTKWLFPAGYYTVVKRFSSKEEKRRVVACVVNENDFPGEYVGFENHLNVFHAGRKGLPVNIAYGLAAFLNSSYVDMIFRSFSGHTQVNATDLRKLNYPDKDTISLLGKWARQQKVFDHDLIDKKVKMFL